MTNDRLACWGYRYGTISEATCAALMVAPRGETQSVTVFMCPLFLLNVLRYHTIVAVIDHLVQTNIST